MAATSSAQLRDVLGFQPTNQGFLQKEHNYVQQYSHIYSKRSLALRPGLENLLRSKASSMTGGGSPAPRIVDRIVSLQVGERVGVVGTIFKEQQLKPCVLDEFNNDFIASAGVGMRTVRENYFDAAQDKLFLEDESGRCLLQAAEAEGGEERFAAYLDRLVTGVVVACFGVLDNKGSLLVAELFFPGNCYPGKPLRSPRSDARPSYLLLTSGVLAGTTSSLSLALLLEYIANSASIARVVIAGGVISPTPSLLPGTGGDHAMMGLSLDAKLETEAQTALVQSLREADSWLAELASSVPCDVMPGEGDPASASLPQQSMHSCLFPRALRLNTFHRATNPHAFTIGDDIQVLGHSGQPVRDAMRYINPNSVSGGALNFLQASVLEYRHLAPTAPDTLTCYPFHDRDPFVLQGANTTDLVFSGGGGKFETSLVDGTRFVCVPDFQDTKQVVLVDLNSRELTTQVVEFKVNV